MSGDMRDYSPDVRPSWEKSAGWGGVRKVLIQYGVTSVGSYAFFRSSVEHVYFSDSVQTIGSGAFEDCRSLASIGIPDCVETIGKSAFSGCTSSLSICFGRGLTGLGADAFRSHTFYDLDGITRLQATAENLRGCLFAGTAADHMVRKAYTDGNIDWMI